MSIHIVSFKEYYYLKNATISLIVIRKLFGDVSKAKN